MLTSIFKITLVKPMRFPIYSLLLYVSLLIIAFIGLFVLPFLLSMFYIIDILLVFYLLFVVEHKDFDSLYLYFTKKEVILFVISFLLGLFFVITNIGLGVLLKAFVIFYDFNNASRASLFLPSALILQFLVASVEEITFRGYIMYDIEKHHSMYVSVIVSSLLFSFLHIVAYIEGALPDYSVLTTIFFFTNMFLGGVVLAILKISTKTLGSAIGFHMAWNFFGYHIFGLSFYPSFFKVHYLLPYYIGGFEIGVLTFIVLFCFLILSLLILPDIRTKIRDLSKTLFH